MIYYSDMCFICIHVLILVLYNSLRNKHPAHRTYMSLYKHAIFKLDKLHKNSRNIAHHIKKEHHMNNVTQKDDIKDGMQKYLKPREQHSIAIESKLDPSGSCI